MTHDTHANSPVVGTLRSIDGLGAVRLEARVQASVRDVWSALTEPDRLTRWLGEVSGNLRAGGEFHARYFASGWEGTGVVTVCEPGRRLCVTTRTPDEPDGALEARITADGDRAVVTIEDRALPLDQIAAYAAGNHIHVEDLVDYLAGRERRCDASARWEQLHPGYQELAARLAQGERPPA